MCYLSYEDKIRYCKYLHSKGAQVTLDVAQCGGKGESRPAATSKRDLLSALNELLGLSDLVSLFNRGKNTDSRWSQEGLQSPLTRETCSRVPPFMRERLVECLLCTGGRMKLWSLLKAHSTS